MAADESKINSGAYRIEPLREAENYVLWKIQMKDILVDMGLWEYVSGDMKQPVDDEKNATLLQKWKMMDCKALTQIRTRIMEKMITYVVSAKTSQAAWDAITSMFQVSGPMAAVLVRRKMFRYMIEVGANMEEQVRTLCGYQEELVALDSAIGDKDFVFVLLTALPDSWDSFISSLNTNDLTTNNLVGQVLAEANRHTARSTTETTLLAKKGKGKGKFRKGVNCYNCGKEGHLSSECRAPKKDSGSGNNKNDRAHHTQDSKEEDSYEFNVFDEQIYAVRSNLWLADSATQSHVVHDRALFTDYWETPGNTISGAGTSRALGRGTVPVTFRVDGKEVNVTLKDVIHAPDIPSNLISMCRGTRRIPCILFRFSYIFIHFIEPSRGLFLPLLSQSALLSVSPCVRFFPSS
jgi:hypothetical protein